MMMASSEQSLSQPSLAPASLPAAQFRRLTRIAFIPTLVSVAMLLARFAYVADLRFRFCGLLWNLFLAWIPLILAVVIWRIPPARRIALGCLLATWVLFFPNCFYITTDLIHVHRFGSDGVFMWYDILMTACFAASGMFLGSVSLYLLHATVRARFGGLIGWLFAGAILVLGSFGIYLGRFLRFNSWDVVTRPGALFNSIVGLLGSHRAEVVLFCGAFSVFSLFVYGYIFFAARHREDSPHG